MEKQNTNMKIVQTFDQFVNESVNEAAKVFINKGDKLTQLEMHDSFNGTAVVVRYYNQGFGKETTLHIYKDNIDEFCAALQKIK